MKISHDTFESCFTLENINVLADNQFFTSIDGILFDKNLTTIIKFPVGKKLKKYNIFNSVTKIGQGAFSGCTSLQNISIPDSVTSIDNCAFRDCSSIQNIYIPNSVTEIGGWTFEKCSSLQRIEILANITSIKHSTFSRCISLKSIDIPNNVTTIEEWAFNGCSSLININIPSNVVAIEAAAFQNCSALQSIHLHHMDADNYNIDSSAFNKVNTNECILYIPSRKQSIYKHHPVFGKFKNIVIEKQTKD